MAHSHRQPAVPLLSHNPWDDSVVWSGHTATAEEIYQAYSETRAAQPRWAADRAIRHKVIERLAVALKTHRAELARLISAETGKVLWEALLEVDAMTNKCAVTLRAEAERRGPARKFGAGGVILATAYRPIGTVAVLGPFNFPGHLPLGHLAPALLAGNTAVFKPSEQAPATGEFLASLFAEAGLPDGCLRVVHGGGDVATQLLSHVFDGVLFTGSYGVGMKIRAQHVYRPRTLIALEMGGNNPLIAWDVRDPDAAVAIALQSAFSTAGQRCSCARRLIVPETSDLPERLAAAAAKLAYGQPDGLPQPYYGTLINPAAVQHVLNRQLALEALGATGLLRCTPHPDSPALLSPGIWDTTHAHDLPDEEIFGPLLQVQRVATFEDALNAANNTAFGLSAGLLTDDPALWEQFRDTTTAGVLTLNRPTIGSSSELPFGGTGDSGNHRPSAYFAADYCSYPVAEMSHVKCELPADLPPGLVL